MSFMFFRKERENGKLYYVNDYDDFKLAGYNLIYQTWVRMGKPVNVGWTITSDDLLKTYSEEYKFDNCNKDTYSLIIDFHPSSKERIGLIELDRIHVYTYGEADYIHWSPLMLELRVIYYDDDIDEFSDEYKRDAIDRIEVKDNCEEIVEFLYINGDDYSWNWGRNGMTNAVFLHKPARDFFRQFF